MSDETSTTINNKKKAPLGIRLSRHCSCNWKECRKWQEIFALNQHVRAAGNHFQASWGCPYAGKTYRDMLRRHLLVGSVVVSTRDDEGLNAADDDEGDENQGETTNTSTATATTVTATETKKKWKRQSPESTTLLDETAIKGHIARLHYTEAQAKVLDSMKRGSSGISYEQAKQTSYQGIVREEDRILSKRSRDKEYVERYFVTPSIPKAVVAKEILQILEPRFHAATAAEGNNNSTKDFDDQLLLDTAKAAGEEFKWRTLIAERDCLRKDTKIALLKEEIQILKEEIAKWEKARPPPRPENKSYRVMNSALMGKIESLQKELDRRDNNSNPYHYMNWNLERLRGANHMLSGRNTTLEQELRKMNELRDTNRTLREQNRTLEREARKTANAHNREVKGLQRIHDRQIEALQGELECVYTKKRQAEEAAASAPATKKETMAPTAATTPTAQPSMYQQVPAHTTFPTQGPPNQMPIAPYPLLGVFPYPPPPPMVYPPPGAIGRHYMYPPSGMPPPAAMQTSNIPVTPTAAATPTASSPIPAPATTVVTPTAATPSATSVLI